MTPTVARMEDRELLDRLLRQDPKANLCLRGDLDPVFWPLSTYWGAQDSRGTPVALVLLHAAASPSLVFWGEPAGVEAILDTITPTPGHLVIHCDPPFYGLVERWFHVVVQDERLSYVFSGDLPLKRDPGVMPLDARDQAAVQSLLAYYPRAGFSPTAFGQGYFLGIWREGRLASRAATHVISRQRRVALLGTIVTHPHYRNQGNGQRLLRQMVYNLHPLVEVIGLDVDRDNNPGMRLYGTMGFEVRGHFRKYTVRFRKGDARP